MLYHHGTTRHRAEAIIKNGPDAKYRETGGTESAEGFSVAPAFGPFDNGEPIEYARLKAKLFPAEGGPAIVEFNIPDEMARDFIGGSGLLEDGKALNAVCEVRFEVSFGLEQLLDAWESLEKRVIFIQ